MNPEVKAKWVTALRSNEYKQGYGSLYEKDSVGEYRYCGLGVLAEVALKEGVVTSLPVEEVSYLTPYYGRYGRIDTERLLPNSIIDWAELGEFDDIELKVMQRNDNTKADFEELAQWIEETF